jgi:glyoxylase-like metal-dependent hydrolase (beta-lactamase superfamily II)
VTAPPPEWWEPGAEEVGDDVFRIPLPLPGDGLRAVNVYALRTAGEVVLVDGGWAFADSLDHLESALRGIGHGLDAVTRVLVTHVHRDHYTQAAVLRSRTGALVGLGEGEQDNLAELHAALRQRRPTRSLEKLLRAGAAGLVPAEVTEGAELEEARWSAPDHWLGDREQVLAGNRRLTAVATPGHTAGHVVFHDEALAAVFSGDHVLPHITPSIGFEPSPVPFPLRDYLSSLRLMLELPDARLLPAHGPVAPSVHARVDELLAHHDQRLDDALAVVAAGASTGLEAASRLLWTRRGRSFAELDLFNQRLAVTETVAHLDVLVLQQRLSVVEVDGVVAVYTA